MWSSTSPKKAPMTGNMHGETRGGSPCAKLKDSDPIWLRRCGSQFLDKMLYFS